MKKLLLLLLSLPFIVFGQNLSNEETKLYNIIMQYRYSKGLPKIPLSKSLTFVAQTHAKDFVNNRPDNGSFSSGCNGHSWSNKGNWTACCYTSNHARAECMWSKPSELTSYKGNGYEISHRTSGIATAEGSLNGWKGSPGHNAVIINQGIWHDNNWQAIGIGIYQGYACVWFGTERDYSARTTNTSNNTHTSISKNSNKFRYITNNSSKDKPYKFLIKIGTSVYSDISKFEEGDNIFDLSGITIDNRLNSVLFGYRKGLSSSNARFSNSGRDMNRGNIYGLLYNYGVLSDVSYDNLNASDIDFKELHIVYSWKEFFRISYGHGTYLQDEIFSNLLSNNDYKIISSGVNLRFGRITTDFNISLLSDDNFQSVYNRVDIGLGLNLYLIK